MGYLASVIAEEKEERIVDEVSILYDYLKIFFEELLSLPPKREIEFSIELILGIQPISKAPYQMAHAESLELKNQLEELLEKGFLDPVRHFGEHQYCLSRRKMIL